MKHKAVCRTAQATPGLLISLIDHDLSTWLERTSSFNQHKKTKYDQSGCVDLIRGKKRGDE